MILGKANPSYLLQFHITFDIPRRGTNPFVADLHADYIVFADMLVNMLDILVQVVSLLVLHVMHIMLVLNTDIVVTYLVVVVAVVAIA